jgi:hypothetical protein
MLLIDRVDHVVQDFLAREYYLLHPQSLAEDALARLGSDLFSGERKRPVAVWILDVVERSARHGFVDPDMTLFKAKPGSTVRDWTLQRICAIVNGLPLESRRIAWLMWVRKLSLSQIARETSHPFERLEHFLAQVTSQAVRQGIGAEGVEETPDDIDGDGDDRDNLEPGNDADD